MGSMIGGDSDQGLQYIQLDHSQVPSHPCPEIEGADSGPATKMYYIKAMKISGQDVTDPE